MNRTMFTQLTYDDGGLTGVLVTQCAEGELRENQFWVAREEAPDLIWMLAEAFDLDVDHDRLVPDA